MLDLAKKIITEASSTTTKIDLTNFGLYDEDISELKAMLEQKPHITQIIFTRNCLTEDSAGELATIPSLTWADLKKMDTKFDKLKYSNEM